MDLRKLKFDHFKLNEDTQDNLSSIYYDDIENEDNWIQIISDSVEPDRTIVKIVVGCEDCWISVFTENDIDTLEEAVNRKANSLTEDMTSE